MMNTKTFIVMTIILTGVAAISIVANLPVKIDPGKIVKMENFPKVIGTWQAADIPLSENDYKILETRNLIMRDYQAPGGKSVYLYIVYSEDNRKVTHPPEVCFMGSGATITEKSIVKISPNISANRMFTDSKSGLQQLVIYWYKAGKLHTNNYIKQQLKIALNRTFLRPTSGALIRLSTDVKDGDEPAALALIKSFCAKIEPMLDTYVP